MCNNKWGRASKLECWDGSRTFMSLHAIATYCNSMKVLHQTFFVEGRSIHPPELVQLRVAKIGPTKNARKFVTKLGRPRPGFSKLVSASAQPSGARIEGFACIRSRRNHKNHRNHILRVAFSTDRIPSFWGRSHFQLGSQASAG